jgi:hypothetical protein
MRNDGCYSLNEVAPFLAPWLPSKTVYRWRWTGNFLTAADYADEQMRRRIDEAYERGELRISGPMPELRLDPEDLTRLLLIAHMKQHWGWEGEKSLSVLRLPFIEPDHTRSDGHTPRNRDEMPKFLVIFCEGDKETGTRLNRQPFDSYEQVLYFLLPLPGMSVHVIDLRPLRERAWELLAQVERERERSAERIACRNAALAERNRAAAKQRQVVEETRNV